AHGGDEAADDRSTKTSVPVGVATVTRDSIVEMIALTGRLAARPGGAADLTAPAAGIVGELRVRIGDPVRRGAVLLVVETPELAPGAEAKAAAAAQSRREAARQRQLLADGVTSARQVEEAEATARQDSAAASGASQLLARSRVTSPIGGRIQS